MNHPHSDDRPRDAQGVARSDDPASDGREGARRRQASRWEWVAAAVSLLLVGAVFAFLAAEAVAGSGSPPEIVITVDSILPAGRGFLVEVTAANRGGETVAQLQVQGELRGLGEPELSQAVIQHVPSGGARGAGLFFTRDPRQGSLEIRPLGFDRP